MSSIRIFFSSLKLWKTLSKLKNINHLFVVFLPFFAISYWNSVEFEQFQFELVYCRAKFKWRSNFDGLHSAWHFKDSYWIHNSSKKHTHKKGQVIQIHWLNWIFDLLLCNNHSGLSSSAHFFADECISGDFRFVHINEIRKSIYCVESFQLK